MSRQLLSLGLRFEHDVVIARQRAREAARLLGFRTQDQTRLATVVSELARRAYRLGERAVVEYRVHGDEEGPRFEVRIRHPASDGDDVRDLEEVLEGARRLLDHVDVTREEGILSVSVGQGLPAGTCEADRLDGVVASLRDHDPTNPFEELQQQNEELVQAMAALREQERERTRLLEAERKAREEAQRAVKGREEILSIVSHDLRNPIGAIQTGARFLLEHPGLIEAEGVGRKQLRAIVRSAERANRLIQDLLDLSSIDQGTLSIRLGRVEVGTVLADVRELMEGRAEEAGLTLALDGGEGLPELCADGDRLVQALANLVSNAIRFTPEGGTVGVEATRSGDGDSVRFSVRDTGPGVPEEHRGRLFDRFWTRGDASGGAGLGLAIVKGIAQSHQGRVWHDPEGGKGACFHLAVPVARGDCGGDGDAGSAGAPEGPSTG